MNESNFTLLGKLASLIIGIKAANVKSPPCHSPGMENGMLDHIMGEIPRRILATAILDRVSHQVKVFLQIDIEWRHSPMTLWQLRFLLHTQHPVILIQFHDTSPLQLLYRWLFMTHNATRPLRLGEVHKLLKREKQQIIRCDNQQIIIDV